MSEVHNDIAYGLGKRAYKAGLSGLPMDDELFAQYIEDNDHLPLTLTIVSYVSGYEAADIKATSVVIDASNRFGGKQ